MCGFPEVPGHGSGRRLISGLGVRILGYTRTFVHNVTTDLVWQGSTMSRNGWRSTVKVCGKQFTGSGRASEDGAMFAAARAALQALGQPFSPGELSNEQARVALARYCQERKSAQPIYSTEKCMYTPQYSGGGGRRKPVQHSLVCAVVKIGVERFAGEGTYGVENAKAAAARCALKQKGQPADMVSNGNIFLALARFSESQGFSEPEYDLYYGSTVPNEALRASSSPSTDSEGGNSVSTLDDVTKVFQSGEPQLGLGVVYSDGKQQGYQREVVCSVALGGKVSKQFIGRASSKQDAKELAAHMAYEWLCKQLQGSVSAHTSLSFADAPGKQNAGEIDSKVIEALRQVCHNVMKPLQDNVLAAILMTRPRQKAEIVCIASGTGFINHRNLVEDGNAVFDCHAEVLVRRGLQAYLYKQIERASKGDQSLVYKDRMKFHLQEGVSFHLFVSKVPCGDACIPLRGQDKDAGRLRYRKEDGEGNMLKPEADHTHYKVCCSAKIALWNVVGLQGALLARCLGDPVYLSTIIVQGAEDGSQEGGVCKATLERALFGRLQGVQDLPRGYSVKKPAIVVLPSNAGARGGNDHSKHLAVCWTAGCEKEELIDTTTGLRKNGELDVSKRGFANQWASLFPEDKGKSFREVKQAAVEYQRAKEIIEACFADEWIHKSRDCDSFRI